MTRKNRKKKQLTGESYRHTGQHLDYIRAITEKIKKFNFLYFLDWLKCFKKIQFNQKDPIYSKES